MSDGQEKLDPPSALLVEPPQTIGVVVQQDIGLNQMQQQRAKPHKICSNQDGGVPCTTRAYSGGLCRRHGASRCKHNDCKKQNAFRGLCIVHAREVLGNEVVDEFFHGYVSRCKTKDCPKRNAFKGYCIDHARAELGHDVVDKYFHRFSHQSSYVEKEGDGSGVIAPEKSKRLCSDVQCMKRALLQGFCIRHARQNCNDDVMKMYASRTKKGCKHNNGSEACHKHAVVQGLCLTHARETMSSEEVKSFLDKSKICKSDSCQKWSVLRGFCLGHAKDSVDAHVFEEYLEKANKNKKARQAGAVL
jgi:hypothetical protein